MEQERDRRRRRVRAMIGLGILLAFVAFVVLNILSVGRTTYEVRSSRLPRSFDGFCIVQLSDLHNKRFGPFQPRFLRLVREARPDLIAVTGDLVFEGGWTRDYILPLMRELRAVAPVFFVTGNHEATLRDLADLLQQLEGVGVTTIPASSFTIERDGSSIVIAGIDDSTLFGRQLSRRDRIARWRAALSELRSKEHRELYTVLLSHRPEYIRTYAEEGFDLVLAGHTHGGQIRIPFVGALYTPTQGFLPRYTSGMHQQGPTTMIVSRGLGWSALPIRTFNPPEIVVVRLRPAAAGE